MKTAEEILESHLTSMLSRTKDSYVTIDEMKQVPEWEACVNAIEQAQKEVYDEAKREMFLNMQYYMEYCLSNKYVTPQEWIEEHKSF
jgi:hypothetical protein